MNLILVGKEPTSTLTR